VVFVASDVTFNGAGVLFLLDSVCVKVSLLTWHQLDQRKSVICLVWRLLWCLVAVGKYLILFM